MAAEGKATEPSPPSMAYNYLGRSGLKVSNICLGCMTFGSAEGWMPGQLEEGGAHELLDAFVAAGGNFIDTADVYTAGKSEAIVGSWLEKQDRSKIVLSSKARFPTGTGCNDVGLSRKHLMDAVDASLARLRTTYIDLYILHAWDEGTPLDETIRTLDDLTRAGKIRYVGLSNFVGWQLQKYVDECDRLGVARPIGLQAQYSLLCRQTEWELREVCAREGVGLLPWSPLKGGWLSGKYTRDMTAAPEGSRGRWTDDSGKKLQSSPGFKALATPATFDLLDSMGEIASKHGKTHAQVAIRWLLQQRAVPSVVIGAKNVAQMTDNLAACGGWALDEDDMAKLDAKSALDIPYPYEMVWRVQGGRKRE